MKKIYYYPSHRINDLGNLSFPIKRNSESVVKNTDIGMCPAWNHLNSRSFVYYSSVHLQFFHDTVKDAFYCSDNELSNLIIKTSDFERDQCLVYEITKVCTNFYWTEEKNVWISVSPHPLTALNNNFYHCGAQFNLSNWARDVNIGAVVVDPSKPVVINRGDPLYIIQFHTEDQNENFDLEYSQLDDVEYKQHLNKIRFVRSAFGKGFDYTKHIFETNPTQSKCPFKNLWKK